MAETMTKVLLDLSRAAWHKLASLTHSLVASPVEKAHKKATAVSY